MRPGFPVQRHGSAARDPSYRRSALRLGVAALLMVLLPATTATAFPGPPAPTVSGSERGTAGCGQLTPDSGWYGDNRARLDQLILRYSRCSPVQRPGEKAPVAVFDWDNTVVKNDVGDALLYWVLRHDKVLQPPSWPALSRWLTPAAARALTDACGPVAPVGSPLPTGNPAAPDCADEVYAVYHGTTRGGAVAFSGYDHRRFSAGSAWVSALLTGHTAAQITGYASRARAAALTAPQGTTERVGSHQVTAWVRYYPQQRNLIRVLQANGFAVWVVSASPEPDVRVWAAGAGVSPHRVIGIESLYDTRGRQTAHLRGCGDVPDGMDSVLTYLEGKRCFVNQDIFGIRGSASFSQAPRSRRAVLAVGDSTTDVTFVGDAIGLRLAINRQSYELMCTAYDDADGRWLINPMFIQPLDRRPTPYPCSTTGRTESDGSAGPVLRDDGSVVPDQNDTVF